VDVPRIIALIKLTPTRANGQPALASYADHEAYGVMVLALRGEEIAGITGFPHDLEVFLQLGLPASYAEPPDG
jgi:hypothetical protein